MRIEPLSARHVRANFNCDHPDISAYFRNQALIDHDAYKVRVQVVIRDGEEDPVGFYSLVGGVLQPKEVPLFNRKFGSKRTVPSIYLAGVAVQSECCRQGIGALLMLDAFEKVTKIAGMAGTACMTLDAIDEDKALWYEKLRFQRFGVHDDGRIKMFVPLKTIQDALAL